MGKWNEVLEFTKKNQIATFGLAETNIEWQDNEITSRIRARTRRYHRTAKIATSTASIRFKQRYKPGGTCTVTTNKWTGRATGQVNDKSGQGRWSGIEHRTKGDKTIIIITGYRVSQKSIDQVGATTAYAQQWAVARQAGATNPEPRSQFITDLTKEIKEWRQQGKEVILMLDANERMGAEKKGIEWLANECGLTDIHTARHGDDNMSTYARGTKKIDFILASQKPAEAVTRCGFTAFYDGIHSDHRGAFADFNAKELFQGKPRNCSDTTTEQSYRRYPKQ